MMRFILSLLLLWHVAVAAAQPTIHVGSKRFTESYVLGEILAQTLRGAGEARVVHERGLGNTGIVFAALKTGSIDLYVDYTGTIAFELLRLKDTPDVEALRRALAQSGLGVAIPLGFRNTYAIAMSEAKAAALGIERISDLSRHPGLTLGFTQEFLNREDGWRALKAAYGLTHPARGLDHGLAYEALAGGQIDVMDVYSTDAKLTRYSVRQLADDRAFFPPYEAVVLYRLDFPQRFPASWARLRTLENRIDAAAMAQMNAQAEISGWPFERVAAAFLAGEATGPAPRVAEGRTGRAFVSTLLGPDLLRLTLEHLLLVAASLTPAVAIGMPLGIWAAQAPGAARWIMAGVGLLQTVPALALLAFLITVMGTIGTAPALVALFLYALLPIVRSTAAGLTAIAPALRESSRALGLPPLARLRRIELPLASRSILAGIKTSAVIAVGTATIAAFIGAGGYGERIVAGLAVNDTVLLLAGAVPAAVLALLVQWTFDGVERFVVSPGLRAPPEAMRD